MGRILTAFQGFQMLLSGRFSGILGDAFEVKESHIKGSELNLLLKYAFLIQAKS